MKEYKITSKMMHDCERALNERVCSLQGLVKSVAKRYRYLGVDFEDLVQEGNIGLLEAIRLYKEDEKASFVTFASLVIMRYIIDAVRKYGHVVTVSDYFAKNMERVRKAVLKYKSKYRLEPDEYDIAAEAGLTEKQVREAMDFLKPVVNLESIKDQYANGEDYDA